MDHRQVIDGVLWRTRTGSPWRDLPGSYGNWKTVYMRHRRWSGDGTWGKILDGLRVGCDLHEGCEWTVGIDATVVGAHQHAAGARRDPPKDIPQEMLEPVLPPAHPTPPGEPDPDPGTGGWVELHEFDGDATRAG